jgi:hypothetical protein
VPGGSTRNLFTTDHAVSLTEAWRVGVVVDDEADDRIVKIQILVGKPYERPKG